MKYLIYCLIACFACNLSLKNGKVEIDKFEKTRIFLVCDIPEDSELLSFSNGFRSFQYNVKYRSKYFDINKYAKILEDDNWEKTAESGWKREKDMKQIIYKKNNSKYIITVENNNSWRELIITDKMR